MEVWKDIPGLEGYYQCSNTGMIKSLPRVVRIGKNKRLIDEKILSPIIVKSGYCVVNLTYPVRKQYLVHTLVARTFLDCNKGLCVNHIDFNKQNNSIENLEVITQIENIEHSILGDKNGQILVDGETGIFYLKYEDAAKAKNISIHRLYKVMAGKFPNDTRLFKA
jgi:hypothetical protein